MEGHVRQAKAIDLPNIIEIIEEGRALLKKQGSPQWQAGYGPTPEILAADVQAGNCYVMEEGNEIIGTATLVDDIEPAYEAIKEGSWRKLARPYVSIHRFAITEAVRGKGYGLKFLKALVKKCQQLGYEDIRIDTYPMNQGMQAVILKAGFEYRGMIYFDFPHGERKSYQFLAD